MNTNRPASKTLYLRTAVNLVPFLLLCYIIAMVDRLNVGYAKLQFMADLHFDESVFGVSAGILYVGYILFEVPSNLLLERAGLRITLLRIMTLWGLFTMAFAFAATRWNFYGLRFLVGAAEAGFFPGVLYYFTLWFPDAWRARITSIFALGVPVSGHCRGAGLRLDHDPHGRGPGTAGLAMAVPDRGGAGYRPWRRRLFLPARSAG